MNEVVEYKNEILLLFDDLTAIYVPKSILNAYKTNATWSVLANKIVGK